MVDTRYLLPCSCGRKVPVARRQAGLTIACGKQLQIPTLREIARLQAAEPEAADGLAQFNLRVVLTTAAFWALAVSGVFFADPACSPGLFIVSGGIVVCIGGLAGACLRQYLRSIERPLSNLDKISLFTTRMSAALAGVALGCFVICLKACSIGGCYLDPLAAEAAAIIFGALGAVAFLSWYFCIRPEKKRPGRP